MKIVVFEDKSFREIPQQDNPAYGKVECLMICKQEYQKPPYRNAGRFCVLKIDPVEHPTEEESVSQVGLFWTMKDAGTFAKITAEPVKTAMTIMDNACAESLDPERHGKWENIKDQLNLVRSDLK